MQKTHSVHSCQADYGRGKCNHFLSCVRPCCLNMLNNAHAGYINKSVTDRYWTTCLIRRRGIAFIAVDIYATVHSTVSIYAQEILTRRRQLPSCKIYIFRRGLPTSIQVLFSSHFSTNFERFGAYLYAEFSETHQLFPFLMDFRGAMAMSTRIPGFSVHPVYIHFYINHYFIR